MMASFMELFRFRPFPPPGANGGKGPFCIELVSEFCLLLLVLSNGTSFSPKKPCSFFCMRSLTLVLDPVDDTVVALAIEGLRSSPSVGKFMP